MLYGFSVGIAVIPVEAVALEESMATHPVFLPRESHGQKSLSGYNPWGCKESDTTEQLTLSL